ncbi:MAG: DUF4037 domain-containing protein [Clostridia bacterium]|nr:DUF4037 domain-containing protein [Clostridia bacterium]
MNGLELSREFYLQYGKPMLEKEFPDKIGEIAVGLAGEGSECLGYDDEFSRDHDFEAGFCMWITPEAERDYGFKLSRAYAKLPKEFMGVKRSIVSPAGGNRRGVIVIDDFYTKLLGANSAPDSNKRWLYTPSASLRAAVSGEVYRDDLGKFSEIREILKKGYPEDIRRKKISAHAAIMAQSGTYNYERLIKREETGAASLALFEFVKHTVSVIYLLNNVFEPFYKWAYRGMRDLEKLSDLEFALTGLTELGNSRKEALEKREIIQDIATIITDEFKAQKITTATCNNLDTHAFAILDTIEDVELRNMNVFEGI